MIFRSKNKIQRKTFEEKGGKKSGLNLARIIFYFLGVVFLAVAGYLFLFSPYLEINRVYIQGVEELEYETVKGAVDSFLGEKYFQIFPQKSLFIASAGRLEKRLTDEFKKISSVKVKKIFPNTLSVLIRERKALLIWCSGEDCFLVDEKGIAYSPADFDSEEIRQNNLIIIQDQSRSEIYHDQPIFKPEFGSFLIEFRKKAQDLLGLEVGSSFETPKAISGDLRGTSSEGWKISLNAELGVEKEIGMLKVALENNISPEKRKALEYIDLRTEGKVYYKFRSIEEAENKEEPSEENQKD